MAGVERALRATRGRYRDEVLTSLIALKAMTSETTGAVIAAPTTSLPEDIGGVRNWDYRYCWLRDSVLALEALLAAGYTDEALGLPRLPAARRRPGTRAKIQIMYGIGGERRLTEFELAELPGYEGSKPVRVGNAASEQFQLDVYGEVIGVAYLGAELLGSVEAQALAALAHAHRIRRDDLARARRRHLGVARAAAPLHLLQGHGVGGVRPCRAAGRAVRARRAPGALEAGARRDPPRGLRAGLRPRAAHLHPVLRIPGARRERAEHPARRASCPGPTNASPERSTRSRASSAATASSRATRPPRPTTGCPATRDSSWPARSGSSARSRSTAASTRRARCSSGCSAWPTISACSPRSTTSRAARQVGNFPQAFSHLTLIGAAYAIMRAEADATQAQE